MRIQTTSVPVLAPKEQLDFFDLQSVDLPRPMRPLDVYGAISDQMSGRLQWAFRIRDFVSAPFGVRPIGGFSGEMPTRVAAGQRLDFFVVEHVTDDLLVLTVRDRHLDVMTCVAVRDRTVSITSSVVVKNLFGRLYMLVVGPAHRIITAASLRRLGQEVA